MGQTQCVIRADELRASYLFRGLSDPQLEAILGISQEKQYNGGDTVVRQYERSNDILIILSGSVKVKGFSNEDLAELGAGHVVGEISLVDNAPRSATVVASGAVRTALVPADALNNLMTKDMHMKASIMETLAKVLCSRLRTANIQLDSALSRSAG